MGKCAIFLVVMAICKQCGATLIAGRETCAACGTPSPTAKASREPDRLLAEANLLRIRGQHDEAIAVCTRILRQESFNAAAHSLLGDIYAEQHNYREALGWYKLALQLNPHNAVDRRKMNEMVDRVFQGEQKGKSPAAALTRQAVGKMTGKLGGKVAGKAAGKEKEERKNPLAGVLIWISSLQPVTIILGCTALFGLIAFALTMMLSKHNAAPEVKNTIVARPTGRIPRKLPAPGGSSLPRPQSTSAVVPPPADDVENQPAPQPANTPASPAPATTPPTPAPSAPAPAAPATPTGNNAPLPPDTPAPHPPPAPAGGAPVATPTEVPPFRPLIDDNPSNVATTAQREKNVKNMVATEMAQLHVTVSNVEISIDPQTNVAAFSYTVPRMHSALETKENLIYVGLHLIWATQRHDNIYPTYLLQGMAPQLSSDAPPSIAFLVSLTAEQAHTAQTFTNYRAIEHFLGTPYWREDLREVSL